MLQPGDHCFDRDQRVVDQQAKCDDQGAQRDSLKVDPGKLHRDKYRGEHERDGQRHHRSRPQAQTDQAHGENDADGLPQPLHEVVHRVRDGYGLVGDERRFDADRQVGRDLGHGASDVLPESPDIAAPALGDSEPDARMSVDAKHRLRRVGRATCNMRDIAEADDPAVLCNEVDRRDILRGLERAGDADEDLFSPGLHHARRSHGVLCLQRANQVGAVDPKPGQLRG